MTSLEQTTGQTQSAVRPIPELMGGPISTVSRDPAGLRVQKLVKTKSQIKELDLSFGCKTSLIRTLDECYYLGLSEVRKLGCVIPGEISSQNCGILKGPLKTDSALDDVTSEWVCSLPSSNCKEIDEKGRYECPLHYRKATVKNADILGNGKVMIDFLFYCIADQFNGRKQEHVIQQNAPMEP